MANIFEKVVDFLNQPIPGAKPKAAAATKPAAKKAGTAKQAKSAEEKAADLQREMRKRELQLRRAERNADAKRKRELAAAQKKLQTLRRQYDKEVTKQSAVHADKEDWTYTVVPGDTLSGIAKRFYGDATKWPEIQKANRQKIKNPNLIYPGQVFIIPDIDEG
jgi:nucleoid-associated protein YgaU